MDLPQESQNEDAAADSNNVDVLSIENEASEFNDLSSDSGDLMTRMNKKMMGDDDVDQITDKK